MTDSDETLNQEKAARAEAATWLVRLQDSDEAADSAAFETWLAADPLNFEAFEKVAAAWGSMDPFVNHPEMLRRRRDALDYIHREDARTDDAGVDPSSASRFNRRTMIGGAAAAAVLLAIAGGVGFRSPWNDAKTERYQTAFGERRVVTLTDGSRLSLDENTSVDVTFSKKLRQLTLLEGQARFTVAHDADRPFDVRAQGHTVRAVGTEFNVDMMTSSLVVTLIEGRVLVSRETAKSGMASAFGLLSESQVVDDHSIVLSAGDQLKVNADGVAGVTRGVDVGNETAWEKGQIVFVDEPLDSAVERLNGYARGTLLLGNPQVADIRISGVFDIDDVSAFVEAVTAYLPVESHQDSSGRFILTASN